MKQLGLNEIREMYLSYFESKGHLRKKSAPLVPINDDSLLLINSGMAPLKPYFTGEEMPPSKRMTTCQKCIRTPDIENVGKTARHGTFFEMLGNFSFGDYFKKEAIAWAWEFVTEVMKIPEELLFVSIYEDDDEAFDIWHNEVGLKPEKIVRLGKADNFWEHGLGPCGPCSEIYFDRGEKYGCDDPNCAVGCECDRYIEFWNLVFTQFDKDEGGNYNPLENPNIDTGMGLERMATIMQSVDTIFEVDTIKHVLDTICSLAGISYNKDEKMDISVRVITDHIRSVSFMVGDGVLPSNEGRGYVLRRLLRRAARHGKLLGIEGAFLSELSKEVEKMSGEAYPELSEKKDYIAKVIRIEEEKFQETIDQGLSILEEEIKNLKSREENILSGEAAFKLYDTFGFPLDLTRDILEESGMDVDEDKFHEEMQKQKDRARKARLEKEIGAWGEDPFAFLGSNALTEFLGYDFMDSHSTVLGLVVEGSEAISAAEGSEILLVLDKTPFYAESGGQVGDIGSISTGDCDIKITDCKKGSLGRHIHYGKITRGSLKVGEKVHCVVDRTNRMSIARNHTATHLLHKTLKDVLGSHVEQAGSLVDPYKFRFDFNHFEKMTAEEISKVEKRINQAIQKSMEIEKFETDIESAQKLGATALFGEKYGDTVRVVKIDDYSMELCGGTHLDNVSQIGLFKIVSENGVASGVRRIEGVTGINTLKYVDKLENTLKQTAAALKATPENMIQRIEDIYGANKTLEKELSALKQQLNKNAADEYVNKVEEINTVRFLAIEASGYEMEDLRNLADGLRDKIQGVVVAAGDKDGKVNIVVMGTKDAVAKGFHAGKLVKEAASVTGGGGGGRPDMAQAGGKDSSKIKEALEKAKEVMQNQLG
ncbi:alanine--tRNA ligase [Alkalibacter saccharofermentans]|uniref:Alanine--tRNA ligase n=1 Tax=Alkalibacter saccharofermentans DSM 14828 TaxID=1120975 RepID=A0A1M4S7I9_9FIRM|nr:alanine--tRNA ligase [Alkalibacter saccharofermentans]SHE28162.1 alanyl-tRNA synthetase [Alkalibacter saccharofermentans DSM 14828]